LKDAAGDVATKQFVAMEPRTTDNVGASSVPCANWGIYKTNFLIGAYGKL